MGRTLDFEGDYCAYCSKECSRSKLARVNCILNLISSLRLKKLLLEKKLKEENKNEKEKRRNKEGRF
jgi:hypothetical protein